MTGMKALQLFLTGNCNNSCQFCFDSTEGRSWYLPRSAWTRIIESSDEQKLILLGGEPTLHPELPCILSLARARGFNEIQVVTNGRNLANKDRLEKLIDAGMTLMGLSVHGASPHVHDEAVGCPGAFREVLACLEWSTVLGLTVSTNSVVTRSSLHELDSLVDLLALPNVICIQFAVMSPSPNMRGRFDDLAVDFIDATPSIRQAIHRAKNLGFPLRVEGWPVCLLENDYGHAALPAVPDIDIVDHRKSEDPNCFHFENNFQRLHFCGRLPHCNLCCGVYPRYATEELERRMEFWLLEHYSLPPIKKIER